MLKRFTELGGRWLIVQALMFASYGASLLLSDGSLSRMPGWGRAVGAALVICALVGTLWSMAALGSSLTPFPAPTRANRLVTRGPYRIVRHPIYGCIVLAFVGGGLLFEGVAPVVVGVAMLVFVTAKSRYEERALTERHPEYEHYKSRVRWRILPPIV